MSLIIEKGVRNRAMARLRREIKRNDKREVADGLPCLWQRSKDENL
jgi:hypothetical protein